MAKQYKHRQVSSAQKHTHPPQKVVYIHERKKKKQQQKQKIILAVVLLVLAGAAFLFSPIFTLQNIRAEGATQFTTTELCERIDLVQGTNVILFQRNQAEQILEADPYISDARIVWEFPNTFVIQVKERKVRACIPYMSSYLYIDEYGRVLDTQKQYVPARPLVEGLQFSGFQLGEPLEVENPEALHIMLQISQMIEKYELSDFSITINVADEQAITATVNAVQVHLGTMDRMDQKIRNMAQIVKTIPKEDRGNLDLSDPSKSMIFQYLM